MVYILVFIYDFKKYLKPCFFTILKAFCCTISSRIGQFDFWCHGQGKTPYFFLDCSKNRKIIKNNWENTWIELIFWLPKYWSCHFSTYNSSGIFLICFNFRSLKSIRLNLNNVKCGVKFSDLEIRNHLWFKLKTQYQCYGRNKIRKMIWSLSYLCEYNYWLFRKIFFPVKGQ